MLDSLHPTRLDTITGTDASGRSVTVPLNAVLSLLPDPERPHHTVLHVADGIVLVDGDYDRWMEDFSANWTSARN